MKQILSICMVLLFLGSLIPVDATLVASAGTIIGTLNEEESRTYTMDNGDRYAVSLISLNAAEKYVRLNINGRNYEKLFDYATKAQQSGAFAYDLGGNNEITIIQVIPRSPQTNAASKVQFAIAKKQGVTVPTLAAQPVAEAVSRPYSPEPSRLVASPELAVISPVPSIADPIEPIACEQRCKQGYSSCMTQEMVGIERICESQLKECMNSCTPQTKPVEPQDSCAPLYQRCVNSVDTSIPGEIEKCVEPYYKCLGYPMPKQAPPGSNQQICEQQYSKCVKEDPSNPNLMYKCKIIYSQCVGNPMPVCGNGVCEQNEEWKTCPSDCKQPYVPPQPVPDCGSTCKDSYSYCINEQPLVFGDLWIQKFGDESLKIGAKVVDDTGAATPEEGAEVTVQLSNGRTLKLIFDASTGYYLSEALNQFTLAQEGISREQKLRSIARKPEAGAVAFDVVIDFSAEGDEMEYYSIRSRWIRSSARETSTIEKPSENYRAQREKICGGQVDQCMQGCGQKPMPYPTSPPTIPPMIVCDNSCYSESLSKCIPYGIRLVERGTPLYCGISGNLEKQKEPGAEAQNNYECSSNAASDGKCLDVQAQISMLQKIFKFFSRIFGGS